MNDSIRRSTRADSLLTLMQHGSAFAIARRAGYRSRKGFLGGDIYRFTIDGTTLDLVAEGDASGVRFSKVGD